jgi:hypothetical protein
MFLKERNRLRPPVFYNLEIVLRQSGDRPLIAIGYNHVYQNNPHFGFYGRSLATRTRDLAPSLKADHDSHKQPQARTDR